MGNKVIVTRSKLDLLADSISAKSGETLPLTIGEMKIAVDGIVLNSYTIGDGDLNVDENDYLYFDDDGAIIPTGTISISANGSYDVTQYALAEVSVGGSTIQTQTKSVNPTESQQIIEPDSGYLLSSVTVGAISNDYVGTGIARKSSTNLTVSGDTVIAPAGYYAESASKSVASGSATTPTTSITANPTISIDALGLITASVSGSQSVTPTVSAGYVSFGVAGTVSVSGSKTQQLTTKSATTINPTESEQTAVAANVYTLGIIKVGAISSTYIGSDIAQRDETDLTVSGATVTIPAGYYEEQETKSVASGSAGTPSASKSAVSNHSISVTPSVTNTTGYITGGTKTGTAVTISASELVSGTMSISSNGTGIDVANYESVDVSVSAPAPKLQSKTATPSELIQTIMADTGYDGLDEVEIGAISSTYIGSDITVDPTPTVTGATVNIPSGFYSEQTSKSISNGSATTPATTITVTPGISIDASGLITVTASGTKSVTPTVNAGYISSGTPGTITVNGSNTNQLTTQAAKTVTPTESVQNAVNANVYTTGIVKVGAISNTYVGSGIDRYDSTDLTVSGSTVTVPAGYYEEDASKSVASGTAGTPTASKGTVSNHSVSITPSVTNTTGYITGGTKTGTVVTVTASELASGNKEITSNGTDIDVVGYSTVSVAVPGASLQAKTGINPTTSSQTITADSGYDGLSSVQINAMPSGTASTPATTITANPSISISSSGLITATTSASQDVTPSISEGYISSGTKGTITVSGSKTQQLTTKGATTITPTKSSQTAVASGVYTTGAITVAAIPNNYITTTDATASASDILSGETAYVNGSKVTGTLTFSTVTVSSSTPSGGSSGDIWIQVG